MSPFPEMVSLWRLKIVFQTGFVNISEQLSFEGALPYSVALFKNCFNTY